MSEGIVVEDVADDVARVTNFDVQSLIQQEKLGVEFAFHDAVEPAKRLVALYSKLPPQALHEFPAAELSEIQKSAKSVYHIFEQILAFNPRSPDAETIHTNLVASLRTAYQPNFSKLYPLVSFAMARTVDFNKLSEDGRTAVQSIRDETQKMMEELVATSNKADLVLEGVRKAAAREGVTQQAKYFKDEAEYHAARAEDWKKGLFIMSGVVVFYGIATLFFRYIPFLSASTPTEAIQLTASKVLVFFILVFVLLIFSKNFNAHKHNHIVNKHRQNALMTFTTLAEAGNTTEARDAVLHHAAAAVYAPNDSGFIKNEERGYSSQLPINIGPKVPIMSSNETP